MVPSAQWCSVPHPASHECNEFQSLFNLFSQYVTTCHNHLAAFANRVLVNLQHATVPGTTLQHRSSAPSVSTRRSLPRLSCRCGAELQSQVMGWSGIKTIVNYVSWRDMPHQVLSQDWPGLAMFPALARHCESLFQVWSTRWSRRLVTTGLLESFSHGFPIRNSFFNADPIWSPIQSCFGRRRLALQLSPTSPMFCLPRKWSPSWKTASSHWSGAQSLLRLKVVGIYI